MSLEDIDNLENDPILGDYQITYHEQIHGGMKSLKSLEQNTDASVMKTSGIQSISGTKTFSSSPVGIEPTNDFGGATKGYIDTALGTTEPSITADTSTKYYRGDETWQTLDKTACGLANVDNTTDLNKPVSTAQQTALNTKQDFINVNLLSDSSFENDSSHWTYNNITRSTTYARTGTYSAKYTGGTGLGEVMSDSFPVVDGQNVIAVGYIYQPTGNNTQGIRIQAQKISDDTWVQVIAASTGLTGTWEREEISWVVSGGIYDHVRVRFGFNNPNDAYVDDAELYIQDTTSTTQYYRGDKLFQTLDNYSVGLGNVDDTSDLSKPVSNATQTALDTKQDSLGTGETFEYLRGDKTWRTLDKIAVGLGNIDNTNDANKPVSTATQTALNAKANISDTLALTGNQTIGGIKTFSSSPKLVGGATVGYVWKATSTDGAGSWQDIGELVTTVDWDNITSKPSTFDPTIGSGATDAAAGNHTHTKSDIGLGNVDNTSDTDKPVSTATQTALDAKVATSRTFSTSSHFTGGGDLSANRTLAFATGGIGLADMADPTKKLQISYVQTLGTRAVGYGQVEDGFKFQEAVTITSVAYRMGTADASGTTTCELRKNGVAVSGTSGTASTSPTPVTGTWTFASGDILTVYTSAIGTTPGKRLTADILAVKG